MKNIFFSIFLFVICFISCKKTSEPSVTNFLEGIYITENNFIAEPSIMYTRNSIITNQQIIQNYFTNHSIVTFSAASTNIAFNDTIKVEFLNSVNAKVSFFYLPQVSFLNGSFNTSLIESTSSNVLLKSIDTTNINFLTQNCQYSFTLLLKNYGFLNCFPLNGGYNTGCKVLREFPLEIVNDKLRMPHCLIVQNRRIFSPIGTFDCYNNGYFYSYFNEMPINQLNDNDTVIVKKMYVNLRHL